MVPRSKDNNIKELPLPLPSYPTSTPSQGGRKYAPEPSRILATPLSAKTVISPTGKFLFLGETDPIHRIVYNKRCYFPTRLHGVTSQKPEIFVVFYPEDGGSTFL
jgi:hypothetical protein